MLEGKGGSAGTASTGEVAERLNVMGDHEGRPYGGEVGGYDVGRGRACSRTAPTGEVGRHGRMLDGRTRVATTGGYTGR